MILTNTQSNINDGENFTSLNLDDVEHCLFVIMLVFEKVMENLKEFSILVEQKITYTFDLKW